jgi:photosystem II stability/assembly factor-like uncharacterized protein
VNDIAIDPRGSSDQTIYIAAGDGGIWKTTDGGATWSPRTDLMPSLSMGSVALDPGDPSIVYAGTGNQFNQYGVIKGVGIYKSMNGGDTWMVLGTNLFKDVVINRIVLPGPNVLLIASGNGLYRSVDGGTNFGANTPDFNDGKPIPIGPSALTSRIFITDLKADTASSSTVYVAVAGYGIFKSTDGGATFPSANFLTSANGATDDLRFIRFTQSTSPNNLTMYANVQLSASLGFGEALFKADLSIDPSAGKQWTPLKSDPADPGLISVQNQFGYDLAVGVDPQDANLVYFGNRAVYRITDGGSGVISNANRVGLNQIGPDQHAFAFSPPSHVTSTPTRFYVGNDGGIFATGDSGGNWTTLNGSATCSVPNNALATALFYQIDIGRGSTANNVYTYGAAQDHGFSSHTPDCPATPWLRGFGGDAFWVVVDPLDPKHAFGNQNTYGFMVSTDGKSWTAPGGGFPAAPSQLYFDPNGKLAYGVITTNLYWSTDNGSSFSLMTAFAPAAGAITALNIAKIDSNTIWLGRNDGTVWRTSDANDGTAAIWTSPAVTGHPAEKVTGIAIDPVFTDEVVVVYPSKHVFITYNDGGSWAEISGNLPDLPIRAVVMDPNTSPSSIIVANDEGVMRTVNLGTTWEAIGVGLPKVVCSSLAIDSTATPSLLRVGTYGRSAFELAYDRQYVDWRVTILPQDGTREFPFLTVSQGVSAPATGDRRFVNIQTGSYAEAPISISQCGTLKALNGAVRIH